MTGLRPPPLRVVLGWSFAGSLLLAQSETPARKAALADLDRFSESTQALAARVSPSVVQINVLRYAAKPDEDGGRARVVISRQQVVGSGVIIDSDGYIVTNAHVIANSLRIRVSRLVRSAAADSVDQTMDEALAQSLAAPVEASVVGVFKELDIALLKVPLKGLPALPFADYTKLRQGQMVFAFGSRHGLADSMSAGVVSSVARQPEPDSPFVYIQTDAPINPGDSGGPLVNTAGEVVGLDTFILTESGGSEGIGFAIPSNLVQLVCAHLREYGHMHRQLIGASVQCITPPLAAALSLARDSGVIVSDLEPDGPAESAGVKLGDIVTAIDGRRAANVPVFMTALLMHPPGRNVKLDLLRGSSPLTVEITPIEESHELDHLTDMIDPEKNFIRRLGIVGLTVDKNTARIVPELRRQFGVVVAALSASSSATPTGLQVGDVVYEFNGAIVPSVETLRARIDQLQRGDPVALYIERDGNLQYIAFEIE